MVKDEEHDRGRCSIERFMVVFGRNDYCTNRPVHFMFIDGEGPEWEELEKTESIVQANRDKVSKICHYFMEFLGSPFQLNIHEIQNNKYTDR